MYSIKAPNEKEKHSYEKANKFGLLIPGFLSYLLLMTGMTTFSLSNPVLMWFLGIVAFVSFYLLLSYLIGLFGKVFDPIEHKQILESYPLDDSNSPSVDVYLPVCGEPINIMRNTWTHVQKLDWPSDRLKVYVLDDGKSDIVKAMAEEFQFIYVRREGKEFKKAGNLKNAFFQTNGDFILILDADFCPRPDFLHETIPWMRHDPKISIVQTPQYFEVSPWMNWIEKGAGYVQELFYRLVQVNRDTWSGSICVGSCALYRRTAIESIGGFRQIEHSEDVWTGFTTVSKGWRIKYLPINLTKGRCPDALKAFFNQQYRWCSGSISLGVTKEFWTSILTYKQKLCYLSGMLYYVASALGIFLTQVPALIMVWFFPEHIRLFNAIFYVPSFIFGTVVMGFWSSYRFGLHFLKLRQTSYYAHLFALTDKALGTTRGWVATGAKHVKRGRFEDYRRVVVVWGVLAFTFIAVGCGRAIDTFGWHEFIPTMFFACFNFYLNLSPLCNQGK